MAKSVGKKFEEEFSDSLPQSMYQHRIADPAVSFGATTGSKFANNNPYDMIIYDTFNLFTLELKSTSTKSLSYPSVEETKHVCALEEQIKLFRRLSKKSNLEDAKKEKKAYKAKLRSRNIKQHQIDGLLDAYKKGCKSYFIFNFREQDNITIAMHIKDFIDFRNNSPKKSINLKEIMLYVDDVNKDSVIIPNELASKRKGTKKKKYDLTAIGVRYDGIEEIV